MNKLQKIFKTLYDKLFHINDSPQKVALGFGLGIFLGVLPGTGPIAALTLAVLLKANKASALIGSLLVNTWINIVTLILAVKIGSTLLGLNWEKVYHDLSMKNIAIPIFLGYFIISFILGLAGYLIVLVVLKIKHGKS